MAILEQTSCVDESSIGTKEDQQIAKYIVDLIDKAKDVKDLKKLGVSNKIGEKIDEYRNEFFGKFPNVRQWCLWTNTSSHVKKDGNKYLLAKLTWGGAQRCFFKKEDDKKYDGYKFGSQDILIYNLTNNEFIMVNTLHLHMIYYHGYYGNEQYKVDKDQLLQVLNLPSRDKSTHLQD